MDVRGNFLGPPHVTTTRTLDIYLFQCFLLSVNHICSECFCHLHVLCLLRQSVVAYKSDIDISLAFPNPFKSF